MRKQFHASVIGGFGAGVCCRLPKAAGRGAQVDRQALLVLAESEDLTQDCASIEGAMMRMRRDILMEATQKMADGSCCDGITAVQQVCTELEQMLLKSKNPILMERAKDIRHQGEEIIGRLSSDNKPEIGKNNILIAEELSVPDALLAVNSGVAGVIVTRYSPFSHAAIILNAAAIPVAFELDHPDEFADGDPACIDGAAQCVVLHPDAAEMERQWKAPEIGKTDIALKDGSVFSLKLDALGSYQSLPAEADIGLLRTEFICMANGTAVDEERLVAEYAALLRRHREVTIRLPDLGADKQHATPENQAEGASALGLRGVRRLLRDEENLRMHLRAVIRAAICAKVRLLIPMVSKVEELLRVRTLLEECENQLRAEGLPIGSRIELGVMIETPAAAIEAEALAQYADFAVIGTSDLAQYIMAADRNDAHMEDYAHWNQPAVIKAISWVQDAFSRKNKRICVCGQMAADPKGIRRLIEMGLREASTAIAIHAEIALEIENI